MPRVLLVSLVLALMASAPLAQSPGPLADCADGDLDAKIAACTKHIEARKLDNVLISMAHTNRGRWYVEKKQAGKALADFTRAVEIDPKMTPAYFNRAQLHAAAGRKDQAIADYRKVLELNPRDQGSSDGLRQLGVEPPSPPAPSGRGGGGGGFMDGLF